MSSNKPLPVPAQPPPPTGKWPLIPERFIDVPSQRLYALSFGLLVQFIKIFDFIQYLFTFDLSQTPHWGRKWLAVDLLYCVGLATLRIPRLDYAKSIVIIQILGLWILDGLLFGGIRLHLFGSGGHEVNDSVEYGTTSGWTSIFSAPLALIGWDTLADRDAHLQGQHTVRMSPISTAFLNPYSQTFCLASPSSSVLIPVLLNNSNPTSLQYTSMPLGYTEGSGTKIVTKTLSSRELKAIESARVDGLQLSKASAKQDKDDDYDEYDDDDEDVGDASSTRLQKSQSLVHIRVSQPGTIRLSEVVDSSSVHARLVYPSMVTIAPCPRAEFLDGDAIMRGDNVRCAVPGLGNAGPDKDLELGLSIHGVPPLSLKWSKEINGKREYFMVEGIEDGYVAHNSPYPAPQTVRVPLTVSAGALGTHTYTLESVVDALGNIENVAPSSRTAVATKDANATFAEDANSKTSRTLHVLRRPAVSFRSCSPAKPASLRIGSEVSLQIAASEADALDGPWDVTVKYQPPVADEAGYSKRLKPWQQTLQTKQNKRELAVKTDAPGQYVIVDVKGKYCEGDVLNPETCRVVELPKPTAEIEWRRIHECSGDTGVAASLVLHGTPPFHVHYRMQRDKEPPRELVKTFHTSRAEMTLQPPQSGHYVYSFSHLSDANYNKVELKGPSIDQMVHPLATASFVNQGSSGRGEKTVINSCSGDVVDVDVELRGIGPWNLDLQLVGPKGSEVIHFPKVESQRKTLQIPVPKAINRDGGSFEIDLVSVEDSSGCKRSLAIPGVSVNVRRVKPTAKFYGREGQRKITTLDYEPASLPLRLTGDGPWRVKYRTREQPDEVRTARLTSANDFLQVKGKGLYEIIQVSDSQCPGTVIESESTYLVDWVPRPSARLSPDTPGSLESYNSSYILPAICEGQTGSHVDLDLTGRPPFQIMYNIARASENGGTKVIDQPTFNSIQPRTRFQPHTSEPGRIFYEVKQIGDTAYPLAEHKTVVIPRADRPLFEQQVLKRPSARFRNAERLSYCLHDTFAPLDKFSTDGLVILEGTPPFELEVSVRNFAASDKYTETITVTDHTWKVDIAAYTFKSIGQHLVTIESVRDASHCEQTVPNPRERAIWVDVAESAAIVPYDRREHFCVGDVAQFQLEGIPPWTIGYRVNSKAHVQEASVSPFAFAQQQPGEFRITSIAHQQKRCKSVVTDLAYTVHPLPSAQVGQGKRIYQDIHEGDQAEIKFTLIGEPPFTFTYQRSELNMKKGGKPGKVLETHTVSGVTGNEYSIFSALEGTWTVTFISDRYCRYPPTQPDASIDR
ncbi:hypothetical protein OF83DRAFT_1168509 [Amylostereum chailletii]|nr:hypothetical protein OF83DRAFT_1168509 [Amylostereum chailletii]